MTTRHGDVRDVLSYAKSRGALVVPCRDGWMIRLDGQRVATVHRSPSRSAILAARRDVDRALRIRHMRAGL